MRHALLLDVPRAVRAHDLPAQLQQVCAERRRREPGKPRNLPLLMLTVFCSPSAMPMLMPEGHSAWAVRDHICAHLKMFPSVLFPNRAHCWEGFPMF
eukprot:1529361-Rhodomonas_salina.2